MATDKDTVWTLRLYVAGQSPKAVEAFTNLKRLCEENLAGRYAIEIVDLLSEPERAREDQILALPTLVRRVPPPLRKIVGDLSDSSVVLDSLDIAPAIDV